MDSRWAERRSLRRTDGFLPAASPLRQLARPTTTAFAAGRAILMELAHPAIAQAVADFDHFREDPVSRAQLTAKAFRDVIHGSEAEARAVARRLAAVHRRVKGPGYWAADPSLALWVHATFVDSLLCVGQRLNGRLPREQLSTFYRDAVRVGEMFGCPAAYQPPDLEEFRTYVDDMVASLEVSDVGRELAQAVFWPRARRSGTPILSLYRTASFGTLPVRLRKQFGYDWGPLERGVFTAGTLLAKAGRPLSDEAFTAVADSKGRGIRTALALAGVRSPRA